MASDMLPPSLRDYLGRLLMADPRACADALLMAADMFDELACECRAEDRLFAAFQARGYATLLQARAPARHIAPGSPFPSTIPERSPLPCP